ncbi:hypothetical protein JCM11641_002048 [Rhodosporidiobolus odoratus]
MEQAFTAERLSFAPPRPALTPPSDEATTSSSSTTRLSISAPSPANSTPQDDDEAKESLPFPRPRKKARRSAASFAVPSSGSRTSRRLSGVSVTHQAPAPSPLASDSKSAATDEANEARAEQGANSAAAASTWEKGPDGKQYWTSGMYWSKTSSSSLTSRQPAEGASTLWRNVALKEGGLFPPHVYHGLTLLGEELPKVVFADEEDGDDEMEVVAEGKGNEEVEDDEQEGTDFELTYGIMRDWVWSPRPPLQASPASTATKGEHAGQVGAGKNTEEGDRRGKTPRGVLTAQDKANLEKFEQSQKPPPYKYIKTNLYHARKPDRPDVPAICVCTPPTAASNPSTSDPFGCGTDCINRMTQFCCDPRLCPLGSSGQCSNGPLSSRKGVPEVKWGEKGEGLKVVWTGSRGHGLKTTVPIKKGDFVIEYRGEIIARDESYRRVLSPDYYASKTSYYFLDYDGFEVIDAGQRGNSSRFINHSCGPNLEVVRWRLAGVEEYQMGIFATRDIEEGEELTYDYGWQDFASIAPLNPNVAAKASASSTSSATSSSVPTLSTTTSTSKSGLTRCHSTSSTSSSLSSLSSVSSPPPPPSKQAPTALPPPPPPPAAEAVLSQTATNDLAHQRCFCGSPQCSGFLGMRRKDKTKSKLKSSNKTSGGAAGAGAGGGGGGVGGPKGKGKMWIEAIRAEELVWAPPKSLPRVSMMAEAAGVEGEGQGEVEGEQEGLKQVKVTVSHSTTTTSSAAKGKKPRSSAASTLSTTTMTSGSASSGTSGGGAGVLQLNSVIGAMRSGREAARRAVGRLLSSSSSASVDADAAKSTPSGPGTGQG